MNQVPKRDLADENPDYNYTHERNVGAMAAGNSSQTREKSGLTPTQLAWRVGLVIAGFILGLIVGNIS